MVGLLFLVSHAFCANVGQGILAKTVMLGKSVLLLLKQGTLTIHKTWAKSIVREIIGTLCNYDLQESLYDYKLRNLKKFFISHLGTKSMSHENWVFFLFQKSKDNYILKNIISTILIKGKGTFKRPLISHVFLIFSRECLRKRKK